MSGGGGATHRNSAGWCGKCAWQTRRVCCQYSVDFIGDFFESEIRNVISGREFSRTDFFWDLSCTSVFYNRMS